VLHGTASFELDPPDEAEMANRMASIVGKGYPYMVALDADGVVAGYAYTSAYRSRPAYRWAVENSVYVKPTTQRTGIGAALTREIMRRCVRLGFRQMIAIIGGSDHAASIKMHEKLGFERVGMLKGVGYKHGKWLDSVILQCELGDGLTSHPDLDAYPGSLHTPRSA
ncbi:MAG: N-acetyltransferase family protein, partial [Pseudomonadota bacterium]